MTVGELEQRLRGVTCEYIDILASPDDVVEGDIEIILDGCFTFDQLKEMENIIREAIPVDSPQV